MNISIRPAAERGFADHGWLQARHSFSFADYYEPQHMSFGPLRVLNEDVIAPGQGFGRHPHRDAEIITYVLDGALRHQDSMGHGGVIRPGEVQYMSAGSGVSHSEFNASESEPVHLLQIWLLPNEKGLPPRYEQKTFTKEERQGQLLLLASGDGRDKSLQIRVQGEIYAGLLDGDQRVSHQLAPKRKAWLQLASGELELNGLQLHAGDGAAIEGEGLIEIHRAKAAEFLLFDMSA
jgi:redox-sensitive bicupin YhaK (pirin superfamily)